VTGPRTVLFRPRTDLLVFVATRHLFGGRSFNDREELPT